MATLVYSQTAATTIAVCATEPTCCIHVGQSFGIGTGRFANDANANASADACTDSDSDSDNDNDNGSDTNIGDDDCPTGSTHDANGDANGGGGGDGAPGDIVAVGKDPVRALRQNTPLDLKDFLFGRSISTTMGVVFPNAKYFYNTATAPNGIATTTTATITTINNAFASADIAYVRVCVKKYTKVLYEQARLRGCTDSAAREIAMYEAMQARGLATHAKLLYYFADEKQDIFLLLESGVRDLMDMVQDLDWNWRKSQQIIHQVLLHLLRLHASNIVHLDISPENVLQMPDGSFKLCDFALAREVDNKQEHNFNVLGATDDYDGKVIGKRNFAHPHWYARLPLSGRQADLWSAAILLFSLCTTTYPYDYETNYELRILEPNKLFFRFIRDPLSVAKLTVPAEVYLDPLFVSAMDLVQRLLRPEANLQRLLSDHSFLCRVTATPTATPTTAATAAQRMNL